MSSALFRHRKALEGLNIAAVGLALAAVTATVFRTMLGGGGFGPDIALITGIPTLLFGTVWAWVLRSPKTIGNSSTRRAWVLSIPLAICNSSLAGALLLATEGHGGERLLAFVMGAFLGATYGAIFWLPALVLTLLCFGLPIARAQNLAKQGLAGAERGEQVVGVTSAIMSIAALAVSRFSGSASRGTVTEHWFVTLLAALGTAAGVAATVLAWQREQARRAFVREVEAGKVPQFRVEDAPEGRVLVRVVNQESNYRVADYVEEVAALNRDGSVTQVSDGAEVVRPAKSTAGA